MKIVDEKKTMKKMIEIYCRGKHKSKVLCSECQDLYEYSMRRLDNCRFGDEKGPCGACKKKCYKADMSERTRAVMRYSGPRMIYHHPIMAIRHLIDLKKKR